MVHWWLCVWSPLCVRVEKRRVILRPEPLGFRPWTGKGQSLTSQSIKFSLKTVFLAAVCTSSCHCIPKPCQRSVCVVLESLHEQIHCLCADCSAVYGVLRYFCERSYRAWWNLILVHCRKAREFLPGSTYSSVSLVLCSDHPHSCKWLITF